tara:strand:- start:71 stop:175 length:105 start_codon:yes stop_codon:yes gene_type:complete
MKKETLTELASAVLMGVMIWVLCWVGAIADYLYN